VSGAAGWFHSPESTNEYRTTVRSIYQADISLWVAGGRAPAGVLIRVDGCRGPDGATATVMGHDMGMTYWLEKAEAEPPQE